MEKNNNLLQILKTLTEMMHCPHCGEAYTLDQVQYISQIEGYCLLQVSCKSCHIPIWVNFFVENSQVKQKPELNIKNLEILDEGPITVDEMITFHQEINSFDGNFKKVFNS
ncbi:MAG: hypothetical protein WC437_03775 [Patescibacteria group bacterium]|nr:hypothetical protein [Patescibacteria group bacterium]